MSATEKVIRGRAYELWDLAGRPDGRSDGAPLQRPCGPVLRP